MIVVIGNMALPTSIKNAIIKSFLTYGQLEK